MYVTHFGKRDYGYFGKIFDTETGIRYVLITSGIRKGNTVYRFIIHALQSDTRFTIKGPEAFDFWNQLITIDPAVKAFFDRMSSLG